MAVAEDDNMLKKIRKIQELFSGRFLEEEVAVLLRRNGDDVAETVNVIFSGESDEIRRILEEERQSWVMVQTRNQLRQERRDILQRARGGRIDTTPRQFACGPCDKSWWRRVPNRKTVSKCDRCKVRYDPVPKNKEWGWAIYKCTHCGNEFGSFGQIGASPSPCFQCGTVVYPDRIEPPSHNQQPGQRRHRHQCKAWDCHGRGRRGQMSAPGGPDSNQFRCVHPISRRANNLPAVLCPSNVHASSGSTVATFLSQGDLKRTYDDVMPSIPEESGESNSAGGSSSGHADQ